MSAIIDSVRGPVAVAAILAVSVLTACGSAQQGDAGTPEPDPGAETGSTDDGSTDDGSTASEPGERSIVEGVYTASQASRGEEQFQQNCSFCHSTSEFNRIFSGLYANSTLDNLYGLISSTMPQSSPGSLAPQTYADIVGYFLELNGYPTGDEELPGDPAVLGQIRVEAR